MFQFKLSLVSLVALLVAFVVVASVVADEHGGKDDVDASGTWTWERTFGDNHMNFTLRLKRNEDKKWTGTYASSRNDSKQDPVAIEDVSVEDDKVSFRVTRERNDRKFTVIYDATVSGDQLKGLAKLDFGGDSREFEWDAKRVVLIEDVVGTWKLRLETRNGNIIEPTLKISREGDDLKGEFIGERGEREVSHMKINDNKLTFQVSFEREGNAVTAAFTGSVRGDSMKATVEINFGGELRTTDVEGRRLAEPLKQDP